MANVWVTLLGCLGIWLSWNMSLERGSHRRKKRGLWDYGDRKLRRDMTEEGKELARLFWRGDRGEEVFGW